MCRKLLILSLLLLPVLESGKSHALPGEESAYERVLRTGKLRCGYALWPLYVDKDPNSGKLSGIFVDYLKELGESAQLEVEWKEEINFSDIAEVLRSNRVDAICSGAWTNPVRGKFVDFVTPIFYQTVSAFVRAGDRRFDEELERLNSENIVISVVDGESASTIAENDFPRAKRLSMPKGTENAQMLLNVIHGKADVAFADAALAGAFIEHNPGMLRAVPVKFPLRVFGAPLIIKKDEGALKTTLDTATEQLLWTGRIENILRKYEKLHGMFLRAKKPFEGES